MRLHAIVSCLLPLALMGSVALAQPITVGGDLYVGGEMANRTPRASGDLFSSGPSVEVDQDVGEDAHVAGLSVRVTGATGGDLYAAGGDVSLEAPVGDDLTAFGFSLTVGPQATVGGNARLGGGSVRIEAPIAGALVASGGSVTLDARVAGDAWIAAGSVAFGPNAVVAGTLHVATTDAADVPESVAPADRVVFERIEPDDMPIAAPDWVPAWAQDWHGGMRDDWDFPGPFALSAGALLTLAFLFGLGATALAVAPGGVEALRARAGRRPWLVLLLGGLGLSALVGAIPVSAATLIGLPLVPIAILALILLWTLGYVLGTYVLSMAVLDGLLREAAPHGMGLRLAALALGLLVAAVLNFVPFLGWMANLTLGFLGIGAMTLAAAERLAPSPAAPAAPPV